MNDAAEAGRAPMKMLGERRLADSNCWNEPEDTAQPCALARKHPRRAAVQIELRSSVESLRERFIEEGVPRDYGFWLAGLTDGEGHFGINPNGTGWSCIFAIKLRADDRAILLEAAEIVGVGRVRVEAENNANDRNRKPQARWDVGRKRECERLLDFFTAFPLRSKKARDFAIWAEAVEAWLPIQGQEKSDWSRIADASRRLREVRRYVSVPCEPSIHAGSSQHSHGRRPS